MLNSQKFSSEQATDEYLPTSGDPEENVVDVSDSIVRMADSHILPFLCLLYVFNYMDRSNLSSAKSDISKSLNLSDAQFGKFMCLVFITTYIITLK